MREHIGIAASLFLALLALGGLIWAVGAWAGPLPNMTLPLPVPIDDATHHLGDQTVPFFDVPEPEGTTYSVTFSLPASAVQDSFLRLETYNAQADNPVQVNGVEVGRLPGTAWFGWQPTVLSVPASALQEGENTLVISLTRFSKRDWLEQWYDDVQFRDMDLLISQTPFNDEFDSLNPRWDWVDLLGDCSYSLTETLGFLTVNVPGALEWSKGHDLWLLNFNAPRLLQPVRGDFYIETKVIANPQYNYQAAGLLVWQDTRHYLRLERNSWLGGGIYTSAHYGEGPRWTFRPTKATEVSLRVSRIGDTFASWYREEGASSWTLLGQATAPMSDTVLVGLAVYNQWVNQSMSAKFDYFHIGRVAPPILTTPCGTTNQVRPAIRGLGAPGKEVRLYADGLLVATTTVTVEGTFAMSPTVALSAGDHILTATVTSDGEESPPSEKLNLIVDPSESIDLIGVTITHAPIFGSGPLVTDHLRNSEGCASCDGSGFNVWIPLNKPITVSVPVSGTDIVSVSVRIADREYFLADPDGDNVYEGTFTPPYVRGLASFEFIVYRAGGPIIEYTCGQILIDPYGVVYDAALGPTAPISGAVVTLYQQDPNTQEWDLWSPTDGQENPQTTGADGLYSFNVSPGWYYVTVEAEGYKPYASEPLQVDASTGPVELPVPLQSSEGAKIYKVYLPCVGRSWP